MSKAWVIYCLFDPRVPASIRYVGVTHNKPQYRLRDHISGAKRGVRYHSACWIRSLLAEGVEPAMHVLVCGFGDGWIEAEIQQIAQHRDAGHKLTNHTAGGEGGTGYVPSAESRAKMSSAKKGKKRDPSSVAKMKETMSTPEYRLRHSNVHKGQTPSPETLVKRSLALRGRKQAQDHIEKRAAANRGKKRTPEHRECMRRARLGRKRSSTAVAKTAAKNRGRKHTAEARTKMSAAVQARLAKTPR